MIVAFMNILSDSFSLRVVRGLTITILLLVPFHAFLTVSLSSIVGHYTALRVWKEVVLLVAICLLVYIVAHKQSVIEKIIKTTPPLQKLLVVTGLYIFVQLVAGAIVFMRDGVTATALGYAYISNLRFLLFFIVCLIVGFVYKDWLCLWWKKLLLWPAVVVLVVGLLQLFVLPPDFLRHFGYGMDTITPFITVDQKPDYIRAQSTLRGPNPLGAYLVVILAGSAALYFANRKNKNMLVLFSMTTAILIGTYSRSAWVGAFLALLALGWMLVNGRYRHWLGVGSVVVVVTLCGTVFALRDNNLIQNIVFHTDETSQAQTSSNEDRANALTGGFGDVLSEPLGRGPGTAGPASVYNDSQARLAENYFLQIGQEVGIIGLALFVAICVLVGQLLWRQRTQGSLPKILLASLVGLTFVNLLSHAWADDTLAYMWWGFAGLTVGAYSVQQAKQGKLHAKKTV